MKLAVARLLFLLGVIFVFVTARLGNALPGGPTTVKVWLLIFRSHAVAIGRLPSNANATHQYSTAKRSPLVRRRGTSA